MDTTMSVVQTGLALQSARTGQSLSAAVGRAMLNQQKTEGALAVQLIQSSQAVAPANSSFGPGQLLNVQA